MQCVIAKSVLNNILIKIYYFVIKDLMIDHIWNIIYGEYKLFNLPFYLDNKTVY